MGYRSHSFWDYTSVPSRAGCEQHFFPLLYNLPWLTAGKSWRPQSISVVTQATAHTSSVASHPLPNNTSGARYCRVPTRACRCLRPAQNSAVPKSMSRTSEEAGVQPRAAAGAPLEEVIR